MLYPSLKSFIDYEKYTCRNYNRSRRGIYEMCMPKNIYSSYFFNSDGLYALGKVRAYKDGYLKKDCQLCKWQSIDWDGNYFCVLYKKCGNPKFCSDNDALKCTMFRENRDLIQHVISDYDNKENLVDVWKKEILDVDNISPDI